MRQTVRTVDRFPGKYVLIKYPNRRIYDSQASAYIRLIDVIDLIARGKNILVVDKQRNDVTREVLFATLAICEEHSRQPVLDVPALLQMIKTSGSTIPAATIHKLQSTKQPNGRAAAA